MENKLTIISSTIFFNSLAMLWDPINSLSHLGLSHCSFVDMFNVIFLWLSVFIYNCAQFLLLLRFLCSCRELGLLSRCSAQASHCGGVSCWGGARASGYADSRGCGTWAQPSSYSFWSLDHRLSTCAHRLNCCTACGTFLDQGSNPGLLHWQVNSLPLSHQGKRLWFSFWILSSVFFMKIDLLSFLDVFLGI